MLFAVREREIGVYAVIDVGQYNSIEITRNVQRNFSSGWLREKIIKEHNF